MKERPMIFNAEMVRAILDGRKTQTRRIVKLSHERGMVNPVVRGRNGEISSITCRLAPLFCPLGQPGDRIWVREAWARYNIDRGSHGMAYRATPPEDWPKEGRWRPSIHMPRWASRIMLEITGVRVERLNDISHEDAEREGIHTEVWDQTVVAKNYAAEDEIFQFWSESLPHYVNMNELYRSSFQSLWQSIYGAESWLANPWVWVIDFKRIEGGA